MLLDIFYISPTQEERYRYFNDGVVGHWASKTAPFGSSFLTLEASTFTTPSRWWFGRCPFTPSTSPSLHFLRIRTPLLYTY